MRPLHHIYMDAGLITLASTTKLRTVMFKGPIARATIRTSAVLGLRLVVQAGTLLLVARMLGPEQFGAFAGIASLAVLMGTFSTFGTHLVLLGEVSKDVTQREHVLSYAVPATLISGSLLFATYLAISIFWFNGVNLPLSALVCIGVTETVLLPLFVLPAVEQLALEKTARSQLLMILPLSLRMLVAAGVVLAAPEHPLIVFAYLYMATAMLALVFIKLYSPDAWLTIKQWKLANKQQLKYSAGYATLALTAAGPSELDKMLAVKLLPLGVSGLYAAASRVIGAATLPVIALLLSALPRLFRDIESNPTQNKRLMNWIFSAVFLYSLILAGFLWLTAPVFEWLFGEKYTGLAEMLKWLCLTVPGLALRITVGSILITMGRPWVRAGFEVFGMLVLTASAITFSPIFDGKGMALALASSEWAMATIGLLIIQNQDPDSITKRNAL